MIKTAGERTLIKYAAGLTFLGVAMALAIIALSMYIFPPGHRGASGYDFCHFDLSTMGRVFLNKPEGKVHNTYFMAYNNALLITGIFIIIFWCGRTMLISGSKLRNLVLICGTIMGGGMIEIGITPADAATRLHVTGSGLAILSFITILIALFRDDNDLYESRVNRYLWFFVIAGTVLIPYLVIKLIFPDELFGLSRKAYGVLHQKLTLLVLYVWMVDHARMMFRYLRRLEPSS